MIESALLTQVHMTLFKHIVETCHEDNSASRIWQLFGTHRSVAQIKLTPWHGQMEVITFKEDVEVQNRREDGYNTQNQSGLTETE